MPKKPVTHKPIVKKTKVHNVSEKQRGSSSARGYDRRWRKARERFLADNPFCVQCQEQGIVEPANEVDHIIDHKGDKTLFWDEDNWQGLCKSHHSEKTARTNARDIGRGGSFPS